MNVYITVTRLGLRNIKCRLRFMELSKVRYKSYSSARSLNSYLLNQKPSRRFVCYSSFALSGLFGKFFSSNEDAKTPAKGEILETTANLFEVGEIQKAVELLDECLIRAVTCDERVQIHGLLSYAYWKAASEIDPITAGEENHSGTEVCEKSSYHALEAYKLNPNSAIANKMMALTIALNNSSNFFRLKSVPIIIHHLEKAVELDDFDWESHHYLGSFYLATTITTGPLVWLYSTFVLGVPKKSIDEALYHLLKSEELAPCASCVNLTKLAVVYYKKSDYVNSKKFIEMAVNFDCKNEAQEKEKEQAANVLIGWANYSNYFKTVDIKS